jgi:hypothetical protein
MPIVDGGTSLGTPTTSTTLPIMEEIILNVQKQVQDVTGMVYTPETLIPYINLAIVAMIKINPTIYPVMRVFELVEGPMQTLESYEIAILDVVCNMTTKTVVADSVTILDRKNLDQLIPSWQTFTANKVVKYVIKDDMNPYVFYVFPPQPPSTDQGLKMIFSEIPTQIVESDDAFPLDESYKLPCINYVLYLVLREETTIPNALNKANLCLGQFMQQMGVPVQGNSQG